MDIRLLQLILLWFLLDVTKPQDYSDYGDGDDYSVDSRQNEDIIGAITTFGTCIINCITKTVGGKCTQVFNCLWKCITFEPPPKRPPAALNRKRIGGLRQGSSGTAALDQIAQFFGCFQDCLLGNVPTIDISLSSLINCVLGKCLCRF